MILPTYKSLEEKRKFFKKNESNDFHHYGVNTIWTLEKNLRLIETIRKNSANNVVFILRGVSEAKYKLYTSAQREWLANEWWHQRITFSDFVGRQLSYMKTDFIKDYFRSMGIAINDLLLLSFLQHYGAPSPLLDFTTDPKVALFFALEHMQGTSSGSQGIENYFSIYIILMDKVKSKGESTKQYRGKQEKRSRRRILL